MGKGWPRKDKKLSDLAMKVPGVGGWTTVSAGHVSGVWFFCLGGTEFFFERVGRSWVYTSPRGSAGRWNAINPHISGKCFLKHANLHGSTCSVTTYGVHCHQVTLIFTSPHSFQQIMDVEPGLLARVQLLHDHFKPFRLLSSDSSQLYITTLLYLSGCYNTCSFFWQYTNSHTWYIYIYTSILTSLPPNKNPHTDLALPRCMTSIFGVNWHGISNNPILCRCWELLNHVSWWKNVFGGGRVGTRWNWWMSGDFVRTILNGAQDFCGPRGDKFWRVVSARKFELLKPSFGSFFVCFDSLKDASILKAVPWRQVIVTAANFYFLMFGLSPRISKTFLFTRQKRNLQMQRNKA